MAGAGYISFPSEGFPSPAASLLLEYRLLKQKPGSSALGMPPLPRILMHKNVISKVFGGGFASLSPTAFQTLLVGSEGKYVFLDGMTRTLRAGYDPSLAVRNH